MHPAASASLDVEAPPHRGKMDWVNSVGVAPAILGRGHFAVVELVSHAAVEEHYALKTVAKQRFLEVMKQRSSSISVRTESLMLRILQHRRIIRMLGCWENDENMFMALEFLEGGDLLADIMDRRRLPEALAKKDFVSLCEGMLYLDYMRIAHRDLKTENI